MHLRNPYLNAPDFQALAEAYPPLRPHILPTSHGRSTIDFQNDSSQRRLTEALLYRDFGITLSLPNNRLCPPVPNRLNYVLWIQDIIQATAHSPGHPTISALDVGTGASAIYPLLACKLEPSWQFVATDIDNLSVQSARSNVNSNALGEAIKVVEADPVGPIFFPLDHTRFDFTMCNPPFYSSAEDVAQSAEAKEFGPNAVCTGAEVEMITPGGESSFVCKMVRESIHHRSQCSWYTSMVGKLSSLSSIVAALRENSITNYGVTEFIQGQTRRWAIAWSFGDIRLPDSLARISNPALQGIMPDRNSIRQPYTQQNLTPRLLLETLKSFLTSMDGLSIQEGTEFIDVFAASNTWSRAVRRKNRPTQTSTAFSNPETALKCCIRVTQEEPVHLEVHWVQGQDRQLFESFCSHVNRKIKTMLSDERRR